MPQNALDRLNCKIIGLLIGLFFLVGCYGTIENFGFKSKKVDFPWGQVQAKLQGSHHKKGNIDIRTSPYNLFVSFTNENPLEGAITISDLQLVRKQNGEILFVAEYLPQEPIKKYKNNYGAYFSFRKIEMNYEEMQLIIHFQLKQKDKTSEYSAEIIFEKEYEKKRQLIGV